MSISVPELSTLDGIKWSNAEQTGDGTVLTTILRGKCTTDQVFNQSVINQLNESKIGDYGYYAGHRITQGYSVQYDTIELTCVELQKDMKNGYYSEFRAVANAQNFPLERKNFKTDDEFASGDEEYATWWNHDVVSTDQNESITEDNWKGVTDGKIPIAYTGKTAYWAKTNQAKRKGEYIILPARLPGVQTFMYPVEQIKEIIWARNEETMKAIISAVGQLKYPENHAGKAYDESRKDSTKWLIIGADYNKRFGWFEGWVNYLYAKGGHEEPLYPQAK